MAVQKAVAERWKKVTGHVLTQAGLGPDRDLQRPASIRFRFRNQRLDRAANFSTARCRYAMMTVGSGLINAVGENPGKVRGPQVTTWLLESTRRNGRR